MEGLDMGRALQTRYGVPPIQGNRDGEGMVRNVMFDNHAGRFDHPPLCFTWGFIELNDKVRGIVSCTESFRHDNTLTALADQPGVDNRIAQQDDGMIRTQRG